MKTIKQQTKKEEKNEEIPRQNKEIEKKNSKPR